MVQEMALRQRFNEKIRTKLGGFGEILATEVSPKGGLELGVAVTLMVGGLAGCTGMGAAMSTSDDPRTRLIGTLMYHEEAHKERMKEAREGKTEVNVYGPKPQPQYEIGDTYTAPSGLKWTKEEDRLWIATLPDGKKYSVNDAQVIGFVRESGRAVDTSNRQ